MAISIFNDKSIMPDELMLSNTLGITIDLYTQICNYIKENYIDLKLEWKFYGQKSGWLLKFLYKKRNLLFLVPCDGYFNVTFVFGDKAVEKILTEDFPDIIKNELLNATKYMEGRGLRLEAKENSILNLILKLIKIKIEN